MPRHALKILASWLLVAAFFVLCILPAPTTAARALAQDHHDEEHHDEEHHDEEHHDGDFDGMAHAGLKGGLAAAIFAEAIVGGLVPVLIASSRKYFKYLHLLNALAGGVFLSSGLTHILPEAVHAQEGVNISGPNESYPLAGTCAVIGFIIVLAVERVFFDVPAATAGGDPKRIVSSNPNATLWERVGNFFVARRSALVLLAALSVHSVLAGLTLGLQATRSGVIKMLVAIAAHKWVASLSLGSHFLMEGTPAVETAIWLIPFALMTPLGIIAGMLSSGRSALTDVVLQGLSAGTFIYVGAVEIAGSELGVQTTSHDAAPAKLVAPEYDSEKLGAVKDASEGHTLPPDATVPSGAYKGQLATPHHHINDQCCDHGDARKESFLTGRRGRFVALAMFCLGFLAIALTNLAEHSHAGHGGHDAH